MFFDYFFLKQTVHNTIKKKKTDPVSKVQYPFLTSWENKWHYFWRFFFFSFAFFDL